MGTKGKGGMKPRERDRGREATPGDLAEARRNGTLEAVQQIPDVVQTTVADPHDYQRGGFFDFFADFVTKGRQEGFLVSLVGGAEGKSNGYWFQPLGWIPGEAVILEFRLGKVRLVDATQGVKMNLPRPTGEFIEIATLPEVVRQHLAQWQEAEKELCHLPSAWNRRLVSALIFDGKAPKDHITIFFPFFRLGPRDPEIPLGFSMKPDWGGMTVTAVYNPNSFQGPGMPVVGQTISIPDIQTRVKTSQEKWRQSHLANDVLAKLLSTAAIRIESYVRDALHRRASQ